MHQLSIVIKLIIFIFIYTLIYFGIHLANFHFISQFVADLKSIYFIFYYAIALIFSIISGFIIQAQWHKWDTFIDSIRGEVNMLRHLYTMAHQLPKKEKDETRQRIYNYLVAYIHESEVHPNKDVRSRSIDDALDKLEDTIFHVTRKFPKTATVAYGLLSRTREYREIKIQNGSHRLPITLRVYIIFASSCLVFTLMFTAYNAVIFNYIFTLIIAVMTFGIYILIDEFDHPYRPSNWPQSLNPYKELLKDIVDKSGTDLFNK